MEYVESNHSPERILELYEAIFDEMMKTATRGPHLSGHSNNIGSIAPPESQR
jgi:hypothetical protein